MNHMIHYMENLDEKDLKILDILKEHSDYTTRQIAKRTLLPQTTVHNRIKKLRKEGIIEKFTVKINYDKIGRNLPILVLVSADYKVLRELKKTQHDLAKEIKKLPEVEKVDIVTGGTDMVVKVRVKDVKEYDKFLLEKFQRISGVDSSQSLVIIHET